MADLRANIIISAKDKATQQLNAVQKGVGSLSNALNSAAARLVGGAGLTIAFVKATQAAIEFEKGIAEIKTLGVQKPLKDISTEVDKLSRSFGQKSQDTIKAYYDAISAGVKETEVTGFLTEASTLALAGATDVATATDLLTSLRNVFKNLTDNEIAQFTNATKNLGKTTIPELAATLGTVAPTAKAAGASLEELLGGVVALTKAGISTDLAMTGLRALFSSIASPTEQAASAANELGFELSVSALKSKGLADFLAELIPKIEGNDEAIVSLFGNVRAFNAISVLASEGGAEFEAALAGIRKEVESGALKEAADLMRDTASIKFAELRAEVGALARDLADKLLPSIKGVTSTMLDLIRTMRGEFEQIAAEAQARSIADAFADLAEDLEKVNEGIDEQIGAWVGSDGVRRTVVSQTREMELENERLARTNEIVITAVQRLRNSHAEIADEVINLAKANNEGRVSLESLNVALLAVQQSEKAGIETKKRATEAAAQAEADAKRQEEDARRRAAEAAEARAQSARLQAEAIEPILEATRRLTATREELTELDIQAQLEGFRKQLGAFAETEEAKTALLQLESALRAEAREEEAEREREIAEELEQARLEAEEREAEQREQRIEQLEREAFARQKQRDAILASAGALVGAAAAAFGGEKKAAKISALVTRLQELIAAKRDIAQGLTFAAPPPNPLFAPATAAALFLSGAQHLSAATFAGGAKFQEGGFVPFVSGARRDADSVLAALTPGELVIPRPFADEFRGEGGQPFGGGTANITVIPSEPSLMGPLLDAINNAVEKLGMRAVSSEVVS